MPAIAIPRTFSNRRITRADARAMLADLREEGISRPFMVSAGATCLLLSNEDTAHALALDIAQLPPAASIGIVTVQPATLTAITKLHSPPN